MAGRRRGQALPRRRELVVDQPVRPRPPGDPLGAGRPARQARPRDAGRHDARARRRAVRTPGCPHRPGPRVLCQRRRLGHRDRAEDERAPLAQRGQAGEEPLRRAAGRLPRRDGRRAGRDRHRDLPRGLRAAGAPVGHGRVARRARRAGRRDGQRRRTTRRPRARGLARRAPRGDRRLHPRAAGAVRHRHGDARPRLPARGTRAVRPLRRAPGRRRDRRRLRPHRHDVRAPAGGHPAGLHLPVQGPDRRHPAVGRGAHHRCGVRRLLRRRRRARLPALALVHRQPARVPRGAGHAGHLRTRERAGGQRRTRRDDRRLPRAAARPRARAQRAPHRHDLGVGHRRRPGQLRAPLRPPCPGPRPAAAPDRRDAVRDAALRARTGHRPPPRRRALAALEATLAEAEPSLFDDESALP